jgi:nucleoside-diphosphate-sugar epimerase
MRVFLAGATGAIGQHLVPLLVANGHEVAALTRSASKTEWLRNLGATPVIADALDPEDVSAAMRTARPEVVVHQLTSLTRMKSMRRFDREFALTNRLRTQGTDNLLVAARAAGARRFVAQSFGNWNYERIGSAIKTEEDPLDPNPPEDQRETLSAIRYLEQATLGARDLEGFALRYGGFYGPGSNMARDGDIATMVGKRKFPIVGDGGGMWSFIHLYDAATATVAAVERGAPGIYNVCDDEPVTIATWLPAFAQAIGAKPPRHVPVWLGRLAAGEVGVSMMTRIRGASNAKAKDVLDWKPRYATYREGFRTGLGER